VVTEQFAVASDDPGMAAVSWELSHKSKWVKEMLLKPGQARQTIRRVWVGAEEFVREHKSADPGQGP
jgi:hypothetical protein